MEIMDSVLDFLVFFRKYFFFIFSYIYYVKECFKCKRVYFIFNFWYDLIKFVENVYYFCLWFLKYNYCFYC